MATKPIRVCLVGGGAIGMVHADAYLAAENVTVDIVEIDTSKHTKLQAMGVAALSTLEESFANSYDLYDVCLPTHLHTGAIKAIIQNTGAYLLCEKPLTLNKSELDEISVLDGIQNRLMCALVERFNEPCIALKGWAAAHAAPYTIELRRRTKKPVNSLWFDKPELGGDILLDLGIHDIDLAMWFADSPVQSVSRHEFADNDHESLLLHFKNGSTATIYLGWDLPQDHPQGIENTMSVRTTEGVLRYNSDTEALSGDVSRSLRPRFPGAYYDEINEAIQVACGAKTLAASRFPNFVTVIDGMNTEVMIAKDRRKTSE